ncbi:TATA-box binding protein like protein, partial [Aduncisulcus paluster]
MAYSISNISLFGSYSRKFRLKELNIKIRGSAYDPYAFPGITIRPHCFPKVSFRLFENGKYHMVGSTSVKEGIHVLQFISRIIQLADVPDLEMPSIALSNICGVFKLDHPVDLTRYIENPKIRPFSRYEPEISSSLTINLKDPKITLRVFVSGRVVFCGHSKGEGLNAEQELSYAWTVPIEEDVITVGDIPSEEDRGTDRDKNTLILVDPAEDARYALTIPNVRPGRWHASKLSRDGTNGECQLLHESIVDDPMYAFTPGLKPLYGLDMPAEATSESVFDRVIEGGVNGAGWKQFHRGVGAETARDGFFIKSMFEKKKEYIDIT